MKIGVAYAIPDQQVWLQVDIPEGSTVETAIEKSKIIDLYPDIDLSKQKVGIYGKFVKLDAHLKEGDRIEIYCPITADPKTVKRRDTEDD